MDWQKKLKKARKNVQKWSNKLFEAGKTDSSIIRRRNLRIKLDNACEERDEILKIIKKQEEMNK
jgi:hypothetical protein